MIIQESRPGQPGEEPKGESQLLWDPPLLTSASPESQNGQKQRNLCHLILKMHN